MYSLIARFPFVVWAVLIIGVGRFRILGGEGLEYWGVQGRGGGQIPRRHMTSSRRHVPTRFLINQC